MQSAKKSLGQNFLKDKNIINKILNLLILKDKNIIEIGPGKGALTDEILRRKPSKLTLIEKDNNLYKFLKDRYRNNNILKIYNNDILKFPLEKIVKKETIILGNLPYNISSQILVQILRFKKWPPKFSDLIFMFQKELGEKVVSIYPSSGYGRLSILSNLKLKIDQSFLVSPNSFSPKPKVTSMIIHFKPKLKKIYKIKNLKTLEKITNILFSNKRKMVNKSLKKILSYNEIRKIKDLDLSSRPSELKPEVYYKIAEIYESK
tara:strand:- start:6854 stop:7639 length:786 start_codon:yes stop_codon:yes gene_type:complete